MPTAGNARLLIPPQSAKPGGLPTNNAAQATANNDPSNMSHMHTNGNHMYQSAQPGQPLSQKSLLSFNALNPAMRTDPNSQQTPHKQQQQQQQYTNGTSHSGTSSIPMTKGSPSQSGNNTPAPFRSNSLSAANAESRRKKEELFNNKAKKRAASASAPSTDE